MSGRFVLREPNTMALGRNVAAVFQLFLARSDRRPHEGDEPPCRLHVINRLETLRIGREKDKETG